MLDELRFGHDADALRGLRRDEPADFFWHARVRDIEDAQAGVEVGEINQVALFFDIGQMVLEVRIGTRGSYCGGRSGRLCRRSWCRARRRAAREAETWTSAAAWLDS